ncbi:nitrate reductase associated protein [Altericista sp. CCNU0014]|uniref:nitrate reductase associated protein n=1 Tax=Altericista sp. CCNU0014 TaxID=3082949 RepID=UPI00384DE1AB
MTSNASVFFQFESDFVESLRCIPMIVRFNLDTCGIKLKLEHWHRFTEVDRQQLVCLPCETTEDIANYRKYVSNLVLLYAQTPASELPIDEHPAWLDANSIPLSVREKADSVGASLSLEQWKTLKPIQRFALIKLSRSSHENRNFLPALQEFLG